MKRNKVVFARSGLQKWTACLFFVRGSADCLFFLLNEENPDVIGRVVTGKNMIYTSPSPSPSFLASGING